jgi:hypothetical protein
MSDPILQEIKDRLNVAEVIAGYIPIKKAGVKNSLLIDPSSDALLTG